MKRKFILFGRVMISAPFLTAALASFVIAQTQTTKPSTQNPAPKPVLAPAQPPVPLSTTGNLSEDDSYRVGPGDVLDIRVFGRPELGREVRVSNQGHIRMPFLEEFQAACLSETQIAQILTEKYKKYLRDPQIDVFVKEYKSQPVSVIGSVTTPGRFQLQRRVRLLELLTFSGGPNLNSGGVVQIIRGAGPDFCDMFEKNGGKPATDALARVDTPPDASSPATTERSVQTASQMPAGQDQGILIAYKLKDVLAGVPESNPYVRPGDIISVPETDQVFVTGVVVKPGPIAMRNNITLLQAIGQAGGFMPEAARNRVKVIRQEAGSNNRKELVFNVDEIKQEKAEDVVLMPNDVIDVPASVAKNVARGLLAVGVGMVGYLPYVVFK